MPRTAPTSRVKVWLIWATGPPILIRSSSAQKMRTRIPRSSETAIRSTTFSSVGQCRATKRSMPPLPRRIGFKCRDVVLRHLPSLSEHPRQFAVPCACGLTDCSMPSAGHAENACRALHLQRQPFNSTARACRRRPRRPPGRPVDRAPIRLRRGRSPALIVARSSWAPRTCSPPLRSRSASSR